MYQVLQSCEEKSGLKESKRTRSCTRQNIKQSNKFGLRLRALNFKMRLKRPAFSAKFRVNIYPLLKIEKYIACEYLRRLCTSSLRFPRARRRYSRCRGSNLGPIFTPTRSNWCPQEICPPVSTPIAYPCDTYSHR